MSKLQATYDHQSRKLEITGLTDETVNALASLVYRIGGDPESTGRKVFTAIDKAIGTGFPDFDWVLATKVCPIRFTAGYHNSDQGSVYFQDTQPVRKFRPDLCRPQVPDLELYVGPSGTLRRLNGPITERLVLQGGQLQWVPAPAFPREVFERLVESGKLTKLEQLPPFPWAEKLTKEEWADAPSFINPAPAKAYRPKEDYPSQVDRIRLRVDGQMEWVYPDGHAELSGGTPQSFVHATNFLPCEDRPRKYVQCAPGRPFFDAAYLQEEADGKFSRRTANGARIGAADDRVDESTLKSMLRSGRWCERTYEQVQDSLKTNAAA